MRFLLGAGLLLIMPAAFADDFPTPPDLPPTAMARKLLSLDPHVIGARAAQEMSVTEARQLEATNYEWSARLSGQQRRYEAGGSTKEWGVELQRPFRLPGKAALDQRIGEAGLIEAEASVGEATHEAARALVERWLDWLEASARRQLLQRQEQLTRTNLGAVEKRIRSGDAARLEHSLARAEQAAAQRVLIQAQTSETETKARLQAHFPGIDVSTPPALAEPTLPEGELADWRVRILEHSDPIRIAKARIEKAKQQAERSRADLVPDPTLGIFTGSEAFGNERIIGLNATIALPGRHRALQAEKAQQTVALAEQSLENEKRQLMAEIEGGYAAARGNYDAWRAAEAATTATREGTELTAKAYALGEAELQLLLQAQQQHLTSEEAALEARTHALRAYYLLLVDGHYLWNLAHDD